MLDAQAKKLRGLITQTERANIPAQKFYENLGFHEIKNDDWPEGITYDMEFKSEEHEATS